jgi:hypothetical protein
VRTQLEDRIVHPMKREPALIVDIVAQGTIDEDFVEALGDKRVEAGLFTRRFLDAFGRRCGRERR